MRPIVKRHAAVLLLFLVQCLTPAPSSAHAQPVNVEAAKKEASVVVYGTATPQAMDVIMKGFEKKYDIKVEYWRASATGVADRALNEWRAERP
ncbi:MAG: hypothetical protein EXR70_06865 [Deltaproteobacteria bacterium]|nr:hypothetical protein [Deltaproteobacteria bacterium]